MQMLADEGKLGDLNEHWTFFASPITDTIGELAAARGRARVLVLGLIALSVVTAVTIALAVRTRLQASKLARTERFLREIADSVPGIVFQYRREATGASRFTFVSEGLGRLYHLDPEALAVDASPFFEAAHPEDRSALDASLRRSIADLTPWALEYRVKWKDGSEHWLTLNAVPHREGLGATVWHGVALDTTERKAAEQTLRLIERRLQDSQRLESLGMLAGSVAHDFNNILTGILGNMDLARDEVPSSSPAQTYLDAIRQGCQRAANLCRQLLAYSGKGRFVVRKVSLNAIVQEARQLLHATVPKQCEVRLELAPSSASIRADETQIHQVVMNLVINAADALGPTGGPITLTTRLVPSIADERSLPPDADFDSATAYMCLEVRDNGCGMAPETQRKIFEPFFTTKSKGHGLGLAAVYGIVRSHNGIIAVDSSLGSGTTFRLYFPTTTGDPEPTSAPRAAPSNWRGSGCVLLVDDEEPIRVTGATMIQKLGFTVVTASDGREAVDLFSKEPNRFRLVLMDVTMPKLDGRRAMADMHRIRPDLPVILMSGYRRDSGPDSTEAGIAGFLQKFFSSDALREMLRHAAESASQA
jgi:PAS domain S-box-containing protein